MSTEVEQIKRLFDNGQIPLNLEWLESCIEFCKEDMLGNYHLEELRNLVYHQWLDLDLREVEIASLPRNLSIEKKICLTGVYHLQLMQVMDISKPKLWQLQRIRNNVAKNTVAETDYGNRVLQLTLTDGVQEVEAMEFKPISGLSINLTPGCKIKIIGPIMVRNGRLMLEPDNIKCLNGSVDELIIKNAAENVLARALGLEENPNPLKIDEKILEVNSTNNTTLIPPINKKLPPVKTQTVQPPFEVDDELLKELEEDFEEESVQHFKKSFTQSCQPSSSKRACSSPDLFDLDDDLLNEHLDQISETNKDEVFGMTKLKSKVNHVISLDSSQESIDEDIAKMPCSTQNCSTPKIKLSSTSKKLQQSKLNFARNQPLSAKPPSPVVPKPNIMTIDKLKKLIPNISKGKFKIKGKFVRVAEKFTTSDTQLNLALDVKDETAELTVQIKSEIVSDWAGCTPEQFTPLRELAMNDNESAKDQIREALKKLNRKCKSLDAVLEIQVIRGEKHPLLISVIS